MRVNTDFLGQQKVRLSPSGDLVLENRLWKVGSLLQLAREAPRGPPELPRLQQPLKLVPLFTNRVYYHDPRTVELGTGRFNF